MVGFSDVSHCDDCGACTPPCDIGDESDITTDVSGIWTGGIPLSTSDSNALRISDYLISINYWKIAADISIIPATVGNGAIIVGGRLDGNNYARLRFERVMNGLKLFLEICLSGTIYTVAEHPYTPYAQGGPPFLNPWPATSTSPLNYRMELCYDSDRLRGMAAEYDGSGNLLPNRTIKLTDISRSIPFPANAQFGIATPNSIVDDTEFNAVYLNHASNPGNLLCPLCSDIANCCNSPAWKFMNVTISGTNANFCGGGATCASAMNGTYKLPIKGFVYTTAGGGLQNVDDNGGDGGCYWYTIIGSGSSAKLIEARHIGNGDMEVSFFQQSTGCVERWRGNMGSVYCDEWDTVTPVNLTTSPTGYGFCRSTGTACSVLPSMT